ncbi:hypothetical protein CLOSTASPAR_02342 [[Clostridium] asparagiforme DSM 15981]|uniref:Uncharacterized protein n=1 Tax=[Clostridium] asparagiforme DSM 15981 TaxID=518636 RepID=C0CZB6_9FIRM|nr:hypothetical protein CLOSTASPAR_02342 [[Clostridium] asparagiforme DSM 15981]
MNRQLLQNFNIYLYLTTSPRLCQTPYLINSIFSLEIPGKVKRRQRPAGYAGRPLHSK